MAQPTLEYEYNEHPSRGLAATGIPFAKLLIALPHIWVPGLLWGVSQLLAYVGYWYVTITGEMPRGVHHLIELTQRWAVRTWAFITGLTDDYPPFETDPVYVVDVELPKPESPSRWWAAAGILVIPKVLAALPHIVIGMLLGVAAAVAAWYGYWVTLITGRLPEGIQDFIATVIQWNIRAYAWLAGLNDEYPPFSLQARPAR